MSSVTLCKHQTIVNNNGMSILICIIIVSYKIYANANVKNKKIRRREREEIVFVTCSQCTLEIVRLLKPNTSDTSKFIIFSSPFFILFCFYFRRHEDEQSGQPNQLARPSGG